MKFAFSFAVVLVSALISSALVSTAQAETSSQCPGEEGYFFVNYKHRNPTKGGFISNEADVQDTDDMIFIGPNVAICGSSRVSGRARIFGNAKIVNATVKERAEISEYAVIEKGAVISGEAKIQGRTRITGSVEIKDSVVVTENAEIYNSSLDRVVKISDNARIAGNAKISGDVTVRGDARVSGNARLYGNVDVGGGAIIKGYTKRSSGSITSGLLEEPDYEAIAEAKRLADKKAEEDRARALKAEQDRVQAEIDRQNAAAAAALAKQKQAQEDAARFARIKSDIILWSQHKDDSYDETRRKGGIRRGKKWSTEKTSIEFSKNDCYLTIEALEGEHKGAVLFFDFTKGTNTEFRKREDRGVTMEDNSIWIQSEYQTFGANKNGETYSTDIYYGDVSTSGRSEIPEHVQARLEDMRFYTKYCYER